MSALLSVLITVSACQSNTHRMYMGDSDGDHSATNQSHKEHDASATPLEVITDELTGVRFKEANVDTSSATPSPSSSGDGGPPMSAQISPVQGSEVPEDAKLIAVTANEATDAQVAFKYSSEDHEAWFHRFLDAVGHAEEWSEVEGVLAEGRRRGYLNKSVAWDDDHYTPLHYAAEKGDLEVVQELIEKHNISVDIRTGEYQRTPLHLAASEGNLEIIKYLISKKADLSLTDTEKSNALHYAALGTREEANTAVIKFLKNEGASLEALVDDKFNLLHLAIRASNTSLVEYLTQQCPKLLDAKVRDVSPLAFARANHEEEIASIIEKRQRKTKSLR